MKSLAEIAQQVSREREAAVRGTDETNIIEYVEAPWGLNLRLYPVQKIILKAHYGLPLDRNHKTVVVCDWRKTNVRYMTEADYLKFLFDEGRSNIREVVPGHERREMVLSLGRRSGKTLITSCVIAFETHKLIRKGNPHKYYGIAPSNTIQLTAVATTKDQAGLLYGECAGHFAQCELFDAYRAHNTQSFARFQTPSDIEKYGRFKVADTAQAHIQVTFKPCKSSGLRGANNIVIALDELAHFSEVGEASAEDVYGAISPSKSTLSPKGAKGELLGDSEGRLISISSPLGKDGFFYQLFRMGFTGTNAASDMLCMQAPTWEVNPTVGVNDLEKAYLKNPSEFFTEYGAQFSDRTKGFIEDARDLYACIVPGLKPRQSAPARLPHFCGIDLALKGDGTAVAIGHINEDARIQLDFLECIMAGEGKYEDVDRLDFDMVAEWIHEISRRFYISEGIFDHWAGIPFEQALHKKGLKQFRVEHMTRDLHSRIFKNFKDQMYASNLALFDWPIDEGKFHCPYVRELLSLQEEKKALYQIKVAAPKGKHDDMSDALVRMVWLASKAMGSRKHMASRNRGRRTELNAEQARARAKAHRNGRMRRIRGGSDPKRSRLSTARRPW